MSCQAHPQHAYFQVMGSTKTPPVRVGFVVAFWHLFRWNARQADFCGTAKQSLVRLLFSRCENSGTSGILAPWLCRKPRWFQWWQVLGLQVENEKGVRCLPLITKKTDQGTSILVLLKFISLQSALITRTHQGGFEIERGSLGHDWTLGYNHIKKPNA